MNLSKGQKSTKSRRASRVARRAALFCPFLTFFALFEITKSAQFRTRIDRLRLFLSTTQMFHPQSSIYFYCSFMYIRQIEGLANNEPSRLAFLNDDGIPTETNYNRASLPVTGP